MRLSSMLLWLPLCAACAGETAEKAPSPSPELTTSARDVRVKVRELTAKEAPVPAASPGGFQVYKVAQGSQVVVAKTNADGTVTTKCVESADDTFLADDAEGTPQ